MYDARQVNTKFNEPTLLTGRFTGAATAVPVAVASTSKGLSIARTNVGALTLTFTDIPVGIPQSFGAWVNSPSANKWVQATPLANPFVSPYTATLLVTYAANAVAVDLTSSEELEIEAWFARTQVP